MSRPFRLASTMHASATMTTTTTTATPAMEHLGGKLLT
jgi:hypothetical protein